MLETLKKFHGGHSVLAVWAQVQKGSSKGIGGSRQIMREITMRQKCRMSTVTEVGSLWGQERNADSEKIVRLK